MFFGKGRGSNRTGGSSAMHTVETGQTLTRIARDNGLDVAQIMGANPQLKNPNQLTVGMDLNLPSKNKPPPARRQAGPPIANLSASLGTSGAVRALNFGGAAHRAPKGTHVIVPGDSLSKIARDNGTTIDVIKRLNGLKGDTIVAGRSLVLDKSAARHTSAPARKSAPVARKAASPRKSPKKQGVSMSLASSPGKARSVRTVRVSKGDTLQKVAELEGVSIMALQKLNNMKSDVIFPGQELRVAGPPKVNSPKKGVMPMLKHIRMGWRRTNRRLFGPDKSKLAGSVGGPTAIKAGAPSTCRSCKHKVVRKSRKLQRAQAVRTQPLFRELRFQPPVFDGYISSPFGARWGSFHEGVDVAADVGTPILAADEGVVSYAGWKGGYGYLVNVDHEGGFSTRYAHCSYINARPGQRVRQGEVIAAVGNTGNTTGPHLHYEIRKNGVAQDPFRFGRLY